LLAINFIFWVAVALLFALQGQAVSTYRGAHQPWWPSFGYSLAIFSVWAILAPVIALSIGRAEARLVNWWQLAAACAAGLPIASLLHVGIFALLYWPIYNGDGAISSRFTMIERMALQNLDTNALFYVIVVGATLAWTSHTRRTTSVATKDSVSGGESGDLLRLHVRSKGRLHFISTAEVDWIGAADDYAEVHAGGAVHLVEKSLAALERGLPDGEFARIHRSALVRLARVAELRSLGRGDASVHLTDGTELRLSRRYRANLAALLRPADGAGPA
jgi:hypothetical protein